MFRAVDLGGRSRWFRLSVRSHALNEVVCIHLQNNGNLFEFFFVDNARNNYRQQLALLTAVEQLPILREPVVIS
jgi:hypothetical protein